MPSEKECGALGDMLRHIDLAERFAHGLDYEGSEQQPSGAVRGHPQPGDDFEASRRLSEELRARHPDIPWREMAAAGNFYRHNYEDVTPRRVWKTLREDLPPLRGGNSR